MNTYSKWTANVFLAKCEQEHAKGDVIEVDTRYGKTHECVVFNLVKKDRDGFFYYSIVRADGFNYQTYCQQKAERYAAWADSAIKQSNAKAQGAYHALDGIVPGQPILIDHYSAKRHLGALEKHDNAMRSSISLQDKSTLHSSKADYWESKADTINLSMPDSIEYYEHELEKAIAHHKGMKDGTIERPHSMALQYANKKVKDLKQLVADAKTLWG